MSPVGAAGPATSLVVVLVAALVGGAGWLLVPGRVRPPRRGGPVRRRCASAGARRVLHRLTSERAVEPPAVRVARAAAEVAALLRAGAVPAAAWAPQCSSPLEPEAGRLSSAGLAAGHPGSGSPEAGPPDAVAAALDAAARAAATGQDPAAALRSQRSTGAAASALGSLALAWQTSEATGAPAAAVLDGLAAALRDEAAATDARDAALAGPRATARLLLALPPLGLAASTAMGADPVAVLVGTAVGRWCAALGAGFALGGWVWTSSLVRAAVRAR